MVQELADDSVELITRDNFHELKSRVPLVARKILQLLLNVERGSLLVTLPGGEMLQFDSGKTGPKADINLKNWQLMRKLALGGTIGAGESFMDGDWDSTDVTTTLEFFLINRSIYENVSSQNFFVNLFESFRHWLRRNNRTGSQKNISAHYDLGNEFYSLWLDPSMTYSSAIYEDGANSLERAQIDKYRSLAKRLGINKNSHVLEIGCGWGGFAEYVGREIGAKLTGLTISKEQLKFARERIKKAGLDDRIEFKFQDYRDETGKYDQIASIEMFEAVGEKYWPTYFAKIKECLKPNGTAGLQIITIPDEYFDAYRGRTDFIQRFIFPGGMLPSPGALETLTKDHDLKLASERVFPQDYARTLFEWRIRFQEKWNDIRSLGFDDRFKRMWEFYLHYCEAGFKTEGIDVRQLFYRHTQ